MKKMLLACTLLMTLSACSVVSGPTVTPPPAALAFTVTNYSNGTGDFDVSAGTEPIFNVAVVLNSDAPITLKEVGGKPQCLISNDGKQAYCRLGDFPPLTAISGKFSGRITSAKLGYVNVAGDVKTIPGIVVDNKL